MSIREQRGFTQEQLGWAAGLHQTAVARIERGERRPTLDTIFKLARSAEVHRLICSQISRSAAGRLQGVAIKPQVGVAIAVVVEQKHL